MTRDTECSCSRFWPARCSPQAAAAATTRRPGRPSGRARCARRRRPGPQSISAALASLQDGNLSENSVESAVDDVTEATRTFADELKDAGKPDTEDGQQAKNLLDQLGDDIDEGLQELEDDLDSASGGNGILTSISQITRRSPR